MLKSRRGCAGGHDGSEFVDILMKAFSQACERNKEPILRILRQEFEGAAEVLEIGSGTGQHGAFFAYHMPYLHWQPSDLEIHHASIVAWSQERPLPNIAPPLTLDVDQRPWPVAAVDAVFSANTAHIIAWGSMVNLVHGAAQVLRDGGALCLYGPMNYNGAYTSDSNAQFDQWLRRRDPASGIRDFEAVDELARRAGLALARDYPMPANNRLIVWRKAPAAAGAKGRP